MLKRPLWSILVAVLALSGSAHASDTNTYSSETLGFRVTKAADWHFLDADTPPEGATLQQLVTRYTKTPLVTITRHEEPFDDLNASLTVNTRPLGALADKPATQIMDLLVSAKSRLSDDFELTQKPMETKVAGLDAAYVRMNYTQTVPDGRTFPVTSELWIIRKESFFYVIASGTRQDEKTGSRAEIRKLLDSMSFGDR